jgi:hypothetical protein
VVLGTLVILVVWWSVSVRHWFKGPHSQGNITELNAIEREVGETVLVDAQGTIDNEGVVGAD